MYRRSKLHLVVIIIVCSIGPYQCREQDYVQATCDGEYCTEIAEEQHDDVGREHLYKQHRKILYWTHFYGHKDFEFGTGQVPFQEAKCKVSNCIATYNKSEISDADAVLFHMRNVDQHTIYPDIRHRHQKYVFFLLEHPYHQWNDLNNFNGFFNLTMTYRHDSDVPILYGKSKHLGHESKTLRASEHHKLYLKELKNKIYGKTKLAAWFVSNCETKSKREEYVRELQKYIDIDVYGKCGPLKCPLGGVTKTDPSHHKECYQMLEREYKFYLSFENIFCQDYVTEKLFNPLQYDVVPVVLGGTDYKRDAPPHSIIDIKDFNSPKELADHLKHLDQNLPKYITYFAWKKMYKVVSREMFKEAFCDLCEVLNDDTSPNQVYTNLNGWWGKESRCDLHVTHKMIHP